MLSSLVSLQVVSLDTSSRPLVLRQSMAELDLLLTLTSRLDNAALEALSRTPIWSKVSSFVNTPYFWYLRVQHLLKCTLALRPGEERWKEAYYLLQSALALHNPYNSIALECDLSVSLLLEVGYDPTLEDNCALRLACESGYTETVRILLFSPLVDPTAGESDALKMAVWSGHAQIVKLLLEDGRADPAAQNNEVLRRACTRDWVEIVSMLLEDPRIDMRAAAGPAIISACIYGRTEVLQLLLADKRVETVSNDTLIRATECGHTEVVKLLLNDKRIDPRASNSYVLRRAIEFDRRSIVRLLLDDGRTDPTVQGCIPFIMAVNLRKKRIVEYLLEDGRVDLGPEHDNTLLSWAEEHNFERIYELLLQTQSRRRD